MINQKAQVNYCDIYILLSNRYISSTSYYLKSLGISTGYFEGKKTSLKYHLKARSHQRPDQPPLWKNWRIGNERALIGESVCWSKIQRGLVGPALRGRSERDKFFNRLKNGRGWSRSPQVVCWAGIQRGGRRYSLGWSYFDRVWSPIQRR